MTDEAMVELVSKVSLIQKDIQYIKQRSDEQDSAIKQMIEESEANMRNLLEERTRYAATRQDSIKAEMVGQISILRKESELTQQQLKLVDERLKVVEGASTKKVMDRWTKIKDYMFMLLLATAVAAIISYFGITLPHL